ncbi:hypothetical protein C8R47DRAFT_1322657 [Mycena vitilis]|nr:hypothetical protein C8R47DRAFT_1322657 [Mycena vitilis]
MGGAGPYFNFDTTEYAARCQHTKLSQLGDDTLRHTWARAHAWLLNSVRDVLTSDGWMLEEADICGEAAIILKKSFDTKDIGQYYYSKIVEARVAIPGDISVFFHPDFKWHQLFGWSLNARRQNRSSDTMYADAVHSCIADYFYLIQVILPGLVGLVREEDYDDMGEGSITRILPAAAWVQDHRDVLVGIFGEPVRFNDMDWASSRRVAEPSGLASVTFFVYFDQ